MGRNIFSVENKVTIVTGASSGFGQHFAKTLAKAGSKIAIGARRIDKLQTIAKEITQEGGIVTAFELDVTNRDSINNFVNHTIQRYGQIDILINNAGVSVIGKQFFEHTDEDWDKVVDTNLKGVWIMSQTVIQHMIEKKVAGSLINISSAADFRTRPPIMFVGYNASKAGVSHLTRALAAQFAPQQIRVNAIAPGWFETEMTADMLKKSGQALLEKIPMHRFGDMSDLDGALLFLASDASSYISGTIIRIDGAIAANSL